MERGEERASGSEVPRHIGQRRRRRLVNEPLDMARLVESAGGNPRNSRVRAASVSEMMARIEVDVSRRPREANVPAPLWRSDTHPRARRYGTNPPVTAGKPERRSLSRDHRHVVVSDGGGVRPPNVGAQSSDGAKQPRSMAHLGGSRAPRERRPESGDRNGKGATAAVMRCGCRRG